LRFQFSIGPCSSEFIHGHFQHGQFILRKMTSRPGSSYSGLMPVTARQSLDSFLRASPPPGAGSPFITRSAHGVLDVLGSLCADSGGTLAQMPLPTQVAIALQLHGQGTQPILHVGNSQFPDRPLELPLDPLIGQPQSVAAAQIAGLAGRSAQEGAWAAPILALFWQVQSNPQAATLHIHSDIPTAAGQAASTSLLAAIGSALAEALGRPTDPLALAQWSAAAHAMASHAVPNSLPLESSRIDIINALTALHARNHTPRLLRYSANPPRLVGPVPLPRNLRVLALDTGVRNASSQSTLDELAIAAAMGTRIIETVYRDLGQHHPPLHGNLANTSPLLYRQYFRALLPRRLRGSDFVRTYGPLPEDLSRHADLTDESDAARLYRVRTAVDHFIAENEHAEQFLQAMEELADAEGPHAFARIDEAERQRTLARAGRLLLASHHSYRLRLELSCKEADWLVDRLMEAGPDRGIFGARITGPAAGGTLALLLDRSPQATDTLLQIKSLYHQTTGHTLAITEA
jgi:L-arabinokinase